MRESNPRTRIYCEADLGPGLSAELGPRAHLDGRDGAPRRDAPSLPERLETLDSPLGPLIDPEGGFEDRELDGALNLPISISVRLGPRILRAETAAIAALAVMQTLSAAWTANNNQA